MELEVCFKTYEDNQDENVTCSFGSLPAFVYNCNATFSTEKLILTTALTASSSYSTSSHYISSSMSSVLDRSRVDTPCSPMWLTLFFGVLSFISFAICLLSTIILLFCFKKRNKRSSNMSVTSEIGEYSYNNALQHVFYFRQWNLSIYYQRTEW